MGNIALAALKRVSKPIKNINIENRAQKVISQEKPVPAPSFTTTEKQLQMTQEIDPDFMDKQKKRDAELHDRLKQVFVSSNIIEDGKPRKDIKVEKPKPTRKSHAPEFLYGFWEPSEIPQGKCTLGIALGFMADNTENPKVNTAENIALKHKLDAKDVENILEYYRVFQVIVPKNAEKLTYVPVDKKMQQKEISDK